LVALDAWAISQGLREGDFDIDRPAADYVHISDSIGGHDMSSKKARRRGRREKESEERHSGGLSAVTLFILAVGTALLLAVGIAMVFGVNSGPGDPPRPGAVWSEAHGHWH
jgi:hypothetical protein